MDRMVAFIRRWSSLARTILALLLVVLAGWVGWGGLRTPHLVSGSPIANATPLTTASPTASGQHLPPGPLPGSVLWNKGASSFLFGTNDTYESSTKNIETNPAIQQALRDAGITLLRTFIPDDADDATIEQRITTVERVGAVCLAVLTNVDNVRFNEHVVSYLGKRCNLYEFGNEPDYYQVPFSQYIADWNKTIPALRRLNPAAKFIGPGVINSNGFYNYMPRFLHGVKASGVLPDAISFHYYSCWRMDEPTCLASASTYKTATAQVRKLVHDILGKDLPIGITEWNYDPRNPPPSYGDSAEFITKFTQAAIKAMIAGGVAFACQFAAASYAGYGRLDMFDVTTGQPKPQFTALAALIKKYRPAASTSVSPPTASSGPTLLSQNASIICSTNDTGPNEPAALADGQFGNWGFWQIASDAMPGSCAFHLKAKAANVLFAWYSDYSFDYIDPTAMAPLDYDIAVSGDSTDGSDGSWRIVAQVRGNEARAREHLFNFAGMSWIRMTVLAAQPQASQPYVRIDEIQVFDAGNLGANTFFFSGDSITAMSFGRFAGTLPSFANTMNLCAPGRYPLMIDGGFGGQTSEGAVDGIASWQALLPDMRYWLLGWGSNDALNGESPEAFRANLQYVVTAILQRGDVPILAHIPYTTYHGMDGLDAEVRRLNNVIDEVTAANHLIPGPDLYTLVRSHPKYLGPDGLHPSDAGMVAINTAWFKALRSHLGLNGPQCG
jgi:lysophospholipase L1-like esterase